MAVSTADSFTANSAMKSPETFLTHLKSRATDNIRVHERLTAFQEAAQKKSYLQSISDPTIKEDERRCTTISAAAKALLASEEFALMISDIKGAARSSDETYPWHCICVLRIGSVLWVYDPIFDPASMSLKQRIDQILRLMMTKVL